MLSAHAEYPVSFDAEYPAQPSRLLALATVAFLIPKVILIIPHFIVLYIIGIAAFFAFILAQFAVLFTGKYPRKFFDFIVGTQRWQARVNAYFLGLTDSYPPFSLH
jgi:hypothetical protein